MPIGTALAWLLVHVINRRSFGWIDGLRRHAASSARRRVVGGRCCVAGGRLSGLARQPNRARRGAAGGLMRRRSFSVLVLTLLAACSDATDDRAAVEPEYGSALPRRRDRRRFRARDGAAPVRLSGGSRQPSGLPHGVVVFHRQPGDGDGPSLRLRADILSVCAGATREVARWRFGMASAADLDGALRADGLGGPAIRRARALDPRRTRARGRHAGPVAHLGQGLVRVGRCHGRHAIGCGSLRATTSSRWTCSSSRRCRTSRTATAGSTPRVRRPATRRTTTRYRGSPRTAA